jgi:uncharacterized membrane protein
MWKGSKLKQVKNDTSNHLMWVKQEIMYSWPIPDPDTLSKYWDINSNFPDRILKLAESEQNFRQDTTKDLIAKEFNLQKSALLLWFIILICVIILAWYFAYLWKDEKAMWMIIWTILFYGGVYIYWIKAEQKNNIESNDKNNNKKLEK